MVPNAEKAFRKLRIIQTVLSLLVLALAAALKVVVILYLQGKNDQLERAKVSTAALQPQNQILAQRFSERNIIHGAISTTFSCGNTSWNAAEQSCVSRGSHLTSVTSVGEQEFIYRKGADAGFWIGLNNQKSSNWTWTDGSRFNETQSKMFWAPGQPVIENKLNTVSFFGQLVTSHGRLIIARSFSNSFVRGNVTHLGHAMETKFMGRLTTMFGAKSTNQQDLIKHYLHVKHYTTIFLSSPIQAFGLHSFQLKTIPKKPRRIWRGLIS